MSNEDSVHRTLGYLEHLLEERARREAASPGQEDTTSDTGTPGSESEEAAEVAGREVRQESAGSDDELPATRSTEEEEPTVTADDPATPKEPSSVERAAGPESTATGADRELAEVGPRPGPGPSVSAEIEADELHGEGEPMTTESPESSTGSIQGYGGTVEEEPESAQPNVDENETTLEMPPMYTDEAGGAASPDEAEPPADDGTPEGGNGIQPYRRLTTRLGTLLVDEGLISPAELERALEEHRERGERLGHYLVERGLVQEADLVRVLAEQYGVPAAFLDDAEVAEEVLDLIPVEMARRYLVVPLSISGDAVNVAMVDPTDVVAIANLKFATGLRPQPLIATERAVLDAIRRLYYEASVADEAGLEEEEPPPKDVHGTLRRMILDRDQAIMDLESNPRAAYRLAIDVDELVDEIIHLVVAHSSGHDASGPES